MRDVIDVVVADDHEAVRVATKRVLEAQPGVVVKGEAQNGTEAWELTNRLRPRVLVLDLAMPGRPALQVLADVARRCPETAVVLHSAYINDGIIQTAKSLGARGFVSKGTTIGELVKAVRMAADGREYISAPDRRRDGDREHRSQSTGEDPYATLSPREREVLRLVAEGLTSASMAKQPVIPIRTITFRRQKIG